MRNFIWEFILVLKFNKKFWNINKEQKNVQNVIIAIIASSTTFSYLNLIENFSIRQM